MRGVRGQAALRDPAVVSARDGDANVSESPLAHPAHSLDVDPSRDGDDVRCVRLTSRPATDPRTHSRRMSEWRTPAVLHARNEGLAVVLYVTYILLCNMLILNLLIALLNNTFSSMSPVYKASQILQRTRVVLQMERLLWPSARRALYDEARDPHTARTCRRVAPAATVTTAVARALMCSHMPAPVPTAAENLLSL